MLKTTLDKQFIPGTNVKGQVPGANWSYLLPNLELERILALGAPTAAALATLSRMGAHVTVACENVSQARKIYETAVSQNLENVHFRVARLESFLHHYKHKADLIFISEKRLIRKIQSSRQLMSLGLRVLSPQGLLYFEVDSLLDHLRRESMLGQLEKEGFDFQLFWLTPIHGETQTAVLMKDDRTIRYIHKNRLYSSTISNRIGKKAEHFFFGKVPFSRYFRRYGVLLGPALDRANGLPQQYLKTIALESGVDLDGYRWALSARGIYNSRKVLIYLFKGKEQDPDYIVKIVRDPNLNYRLENEDSALRQLQTRDTIEKDSLPHPVFFGLHAGVAILGETSVPGAPFWKKSSGEADCPIGQAAIRWITRLSTSRPSVLSSTSGELSDKWFDGWEPFASGQRVASRLWELFERVQSIYRLSAQHNRFLANQINRIASYSGELPLVFQHGDPGTWNVLVMPGGRVAFLDWEAADPAGMPLWDLFYFLRSYSIGNGRHYGLKHRLMVFKQQFMQDSPVSSLIVNSVEDYCKTVGLAPELVEPLFYTCWVHRSLKQATLLPEHKLDRGYYLNLLRLTIDQRSSSTLMRMFKT